MPAFIRGEGCLVNASDVQEIHHSGAFGGIVGLKTAVANTTSHGTVVARLLGEDAWNRAGKEQQDDTETHTGRAELVAEALAVCIHTYANAPQSFCISFNADSPEWWEVSNQD